MKYFFKKVKIIKYTHTQLEKKLDDCFGIGEFNKLINNVDTSALVKNLIWKNNIDVNLFKKVKKL